MRFMLGASSPATKGKRSQPAGLSDRAYFSYKPAYCGGVHAPTTVRGHIIISLLV